MSDRSGTSLKLHPNALGAIEQPLQVKSGERIVGVLPDQSRKCRHRAGFPCLELGEGADILRGDGIFELGPWQRLERPQRLAASAQHQVADGAALKSLCPLG